MGTTVTKILDDFGIEYIIKKHQNPVFTCEDAARERNVRISQILKCMVGKDTSSNVHVMLLPGDRILKIKKVRQIAGGIKIDLVPPVELSAEFGVTVGAISPVQFLGKAKFYLDKTSLLEEIVDISSGLLDAGVELKLSSLVDLIDPIICDIISSNVKETQ
jgi:prolyl-tRNA editing enzyme YbaK/EbsC (Cys-tRNA(Pro) deacylase)